MDKIQKIKETVYKGKIEDYPFPEKDAYQHLHRSVFLYGHSMDHSDLSFRAALMQRKCDGYRLTLLDESKFKVGTDTPTCRAAYYHYLNDQKIPFLEEFALEQGIDKILDVLILMKPMEVSNKLCSTINKLQSSFTWTPYVHTGCIDGMMYILQKPFCRVALFETLHIVADVKVKFDKSMLHVDDEAGCPCVEYKKALLKKNNGKAKESEN